MNALDWALIATAAIAVVSVLTLIASYDRDADEHDLSDYRPPPIPQDDPTCRYVLYDGKVYRKPWAEVDTDDVVDEAPDYGWGYTDDDILPPAPAGMDAGSPLYAAMLFDTWHPESAEVTARRFLREIAEERRAELVAA